MHLPANKSMVPLEDVMMGVSYPRESTEGGDSNSKIRCNTDRKNGVMAHITVEESIDHLENKPATPRKSAAAVATAKMLQTTHQIREPL